jgi:hypothetical protein
MTSPSCFPPGAVEPRVGTRRGGCDPSSARFFNLDFNLHGRRLLLLWNDEGVRFMMMMMMMMMGRNGPSDMTGFGSTE